MKARLLIGCCAMALAACAQSIEAEPDGPHGSLALALTGTDSAGVTYWLRNAQFEVSGYPEGFPMYPTGPVGGMGGATPPLPDGYFYSQFSSDDYPDDATINLQLVPGYYNVSLINRDWYLERSTDGGPRERVEQAVLLSPAYQGAYIWDGGIAQVNFRFGVDGELIDFRSGQLQIGVEIEKPGENCPGGGWAGWGPVPGPCGVAGRGGGTAGAAGGGVGGAGFL